VEDSALGDLRVVECVSGLAGAFAAKALADLGAGTVVVEPPSGHATRRSGPFPGDLSHPERSGQFLYLFANKRGVTLDLDLPRDRDALCSLLADTDVLITEAPTARLHDLGLAYPDLAAVNPRLIETVISPFGLSGPYSDRKGSDLVCWHMGGTGAGTPFNGVTRPDEQPPLRGGGYQASYATGWAAAAATLAAVFYRETYGTGQLVDVSAMEAVASMMRAAIGNFSYDPSTARTSRLKAASPWIYPCKDGFVSTSHGREHWWDALKGLMKRPDWAESPVFATAALRREHADALDAGLSDWLSGYTRAELYGMLVPHGIPCFPVQTMDEVTGSPQYRARGAIVEQQHPLAGTILQPGPTVRLSGTPWRLRRPAPLLGQHNDEVLGLAHGQQAAKASPRPPFEAAPTPTRASPVDAGKRNRPLAGIRILDFGWILSVPHCTAWLGTLGAEVIRVESHARLDTGRLGVGGGADGVPGPNRSGGFNGLNYSKQSITLNIPTEAGRALARDLIATSDVVCENFATGVMDRLGLGYEALSALRPDIVMLSGSTLGTDGPEREATGWGPNVCAYAGLPAISGYEDGPPADLGGVWPDYCIGTVMVFALLSALHHRQRTGRGQHVEIAMGEVVTAMIPEAVLEYTMNGRQRPRLGNRDLDMAPHGVYPCDGDDRWIAIAVEDDTAWRALCSVIGRTALADEPRFTNVEARLRHQDELDSLLAAWTATRTLGEATAVLQAAGVAAGAVATILDLMEDPQLLARRFLVTIDHPEVGPRVVAGLPVTFSAMPDLAYGPAPCLGEHNDAVFGSLLHLPADDMRRLQEAQIIY